ncbi:DUF5615 family PIN-like protein [Bradyrhizobium sp.]|uniref:DUF5615 family PIN-like protein n=1 Tax=Bradyrhizobium sp. TaxID=376 RepID=UPI003C7111BB
MALLGAIGKRALNQRFLIDECLSGALVAVAKAQGYPADYVTHLGKAGWQDWNLVRFAVANDYIIVTDNRKDFLRECRVRSPMPVAARPIWCRKGYSRT